MSQVRRVGAPGLQESRALWPGAFTGRLTHFPWDQEVGRAMKAQEEGRVKRPKTLHRNAVGIQSHPGKVSHPRKRVLRRRQ